jgi:hypothetical protein
VSALTPTEWSLRRDPAVGLPHQGRRRTEKLREEGRKVVAHPQLGLVAACARETTARLTDFKPNTHSEFRPARATPCHSLLFAGAATLGADLRE